MAGTIRRPMPMDHKKIAKARKAAGLTQQQVADAIQMPQQSYARLERRQYDCRISTLEKIAKVLGVTLFDLLTSPRPKR